MRNTHTQNEKKSRENEKNNNNRASIERAHYRYTVYLIVRWIVCETMGLAANVCKYLA